MSDELKNSFESLEKAFAKLEFGANTADKELEIDGVIQRFEFTFELIWKTLKLFLLDQGIRAVSPREAFKESFRFGIIKDQETFLNIISDRNNTVHIYNEEKSREIFQRIKEEYLLVIKNLISEIESYEL